MFRLRAGAQNSVSHSCSEKNVHSGELPNREEVTGAGGREAGPGSGGPGRPRGRAFPGFTVYGGKSHIPATIPPKAASEMNEDTIKVCFQAGILHKCQKECDVSVRTDAKGFPKNILGLRNKSQPKVERYVS